MRYYNLDIPNQWFRPTIQCFNAMVGSVVAFHQGMNAYAP